MNDPNEPNRPVGVLLITLGTPDSPATGDVRRYLREFLSDPRVLTMPSAARWLLLHGIILPFRPRKSAAAYQSIWSDNGSPLLDAGKSLKNLLGETLSEEHRVGLGMRYGNPSIETALRSMFDERGGPMPRELVVVPLFPQYASASTGSAVAKLGEVLEALKIEIPVHIAAPFYEHPSFIDASASIAQPLLAGFAPDHVVMSFHGLPEQQVRDLDPTGAHCLVEPDCCTKPCAANRSCYRAQCFATTRALQGALDLPDERISIAFQSRLGRARWLEPDLVDLLPQLAARGVGRIAVMCPAFVADCLETLEEIGIRAREQWASLGGEDLCLIPCVNADPSWVAGLAKIVRETAGAPITANERPS